MMGWPGSGSGCNEQVAAPADGRTPGVAAMKILVANLGSTSLKWRLFDCSCGREDLLHRGGFDRVTDYGNAIEGCVAELKKSGAIESEKDLAAVGFKTIMA